MQEYSEDYLLDKRVRIFQPLNGYRASTDAVILSSLIARIKDGDAVLASVPAPAPSPSAWPKGSKRCGPKLRDLNCRLNWPSCQT